MIKSQAAVDEERGRGRKHYYGSLPSVLPIRTQSNILLRYSPISAPISLGGPGASLELSAEEMFPLQPSVVTGGHIGNQSWNRRRSQRADPSAQDRLLSGQELLHHGWGGEQGEPVHCTHTSLMYIQHTGQCKWLSLMGSGVSCWKESFVVL